jgi:hypothetical protein
VFSTENEVLKRNNHKLKNYMTRAMSAGEKKMLVNSLLNLPEKQKAFINKIIKVKVNATYSRVEDKISKLPATTCRKLEKYVKLSY